MIFNPMLTGGWAGTKITVNPQYITRTTAEIYDRCVDITIQGLTRENIKNGCFVVCSDYTENGAISVKGCVLYIGKDGKTIFTTSGNGEYTIQQPYNAAAGTVTIRALNFRVVTTPIIVLE